MITRGARNVLREHREVDVSHVLQIRQHVLAPDVVGVDIAGLRKGIALHAGKLPGYPASHGCIRLPHKFSALLFGATELGMTVIITDIAALPQISGAPDVAIESVGSDQQTLARAAYQWHPERAADGIVSVVISAADQRAIVMRGGSRSALHLSPCRRRDRWRHGLCFARLGR